MEQTFIKFARCRMGGHPLHLIIPMRKINVILLTALLGSALSMVHPADKLRLGDIPDEQEKREQQKKRKQNKEDQDMTPEEKKLVVDQLANDAYRKGVLAKKNHHWIDAEKYFEKTLLLSPNHLAAKQNLETVRQAIAQQKTAETPKAMAAPAEPTTKKPKAMPAEGPKPAPTISLPPGEAKQKADALYREALELNRNGDYERAYTACQEALKYDPSNLQAQRMAERLSARVNRR